MQFAVLGSLQVVGDEGPVLIPARMERLLLSVLLVNAGAVVAADALVDLLWGDEPPRSANKTLQTYVSHLRRFLGARLRTEPPGYRLDVEAGALDAEEFRTAVAAARLELVCRRPAEAARQLDGALRLWRGQPFAEFADHPALSAEAARLDAFRLGAIEDWIEARLDSGQIRGLDGELEALVAAHPFRERLWALLMRVLYANGRQADALGVFQRARGMLVEELGIEPGPELRAVEAAVLAQDASLGRSGPHEVLPTRYARAADGLEIAYWTRGRGDRDVVFVAEWTMNIDLLLELVTFRPFLDRLAGVGRLVAVQRRDAGASGRDPRGGFASPEGCVGDIDAVLDEVGSDRAALVGWGHGGQVALAYAAARPERVGSVAAITSYARLGSTPDHPAGLTPDFLDAFLGEVEKVWGAMEPKFPIFDPSVAYDPALITRVARLERLTFTPARMVEIQRIAYGFDIRPLLPSVRCPVLVVGLEQSVTGTASARLLADLLPSATYLELPGHFVPSAPHSDALGAAVVEFLVAPAGQSTAQVEPAQPAKSFQSGPMGA